MEITAQALDTVNDLIQLNNDRVAGFEKAGTDLENADSRLIEVFNLLADESRQYVVELTDIARQYAGEAAEGTSTSGDLHRAWIDVKAVFTGNDLEAILNECERGEDAIKSAYESALNEDNELPAELIQVLHIQQQGIVEGHNLIRSLRDQAERVADNETEEAEEVKNTEFRDGEPVNTGGAEPVISNDFEGKEYETLSGPEPVGTENEQYVDDYAGEEFAPEPDAFEDEATISTGNSKLMEFFLNELKDLLWAEQELVGTLPDMADAATSPELKAAFENHLAETEVHVTRIEQAFAMLGLEPDTTKCDAMAGIVEEGDEIISDTEEGTAQRDVGLIFAGQKAEHYEIASYGGMISLAKTLGYNNIAELFVQTIDEEKSADALLTRIAENHVNYEASTEAAED